LLIRRLQRYVQAVSNCALADLANAVLIHVGGHHAQDAQSGRVMRS
jgi:hypothetical protein